MRFDEAGQTTEIEIDELERILGHPLPLDYRQHLLQHDGGHPEYDLFEYRREGELWLAGIAFFYSVAPNQHIGIMQKCLVFAERIPQEFFPFANNGGGDQYIMGKPGTEFDGKIYIWEHEFEADEGEPPRWDNIHHIADSFSEFMDMLRPPDWR
jgi:hypothetical protein